MFKFLRAHTISLQNARIMSIRSTTHCSMRICSFCNYCHFTSPKLIKNIVFRRYATMNTAELYTPLRKKTKRSKKYAELLEVTDQTIGNKKTTVQKLNAAHISILVGQRNTTLDKLHKIGSSHLNKKTHTTQATETSTNLKNNSKDKLDDVHHIILEESKNNLEDKTMILGELEESGISDSATLIKNTTFINTLHEVKSEEENQDDFINSKLPKTSKSRKTSEFSKIPFTKEKDLFETCPSDHNLISQLLAHIDVYNHNGMLNKGFKLLMLKRSRLSATKIPTTAVYNLLIKAYASKLHLGRVSEIYNLMNENHVQLDAETFALMFQMIGNMKSQTKQAEMITKVVEDMNQHGVFFDDVLNISQMKGTQREAIYKCVCLASPEHNASYPDFERPYNCKLLQNLKLDNYHSPAKGVVTLDELRQMIQTQINTEMQQELEVKNIDRFTGDVNIRLQAIERIAEWEKSWKLSVTEAFEKNLFYLKQKEMREQPELSTLYPFLQVLSQEEYVDAILREIKRLARSSDAYSFSLTFVYLILGKYIYKKYEFHKKKEAKVTDNIIQVYNKYLEWYIQQKPTDVGINGRIKWQQLAQEVMKAGLCPDITVPEWPRHILVNIGKFLYSIIVNDVKIPYGIKPGAPERLIPAFYLLFRNQHAYLTEEIKPHPHLHRTFSESHPETLTFETVLLPTYIPPRPWINTNIGGFLFSKTDFIRDPYVGMSSMYFIKNTPTEQLYPALDCLNQLGSIPWRINQPVLDILIQIFREGGSEELNVPQSPLSFPFLSEWMKELAEKEKSRSKISTLAIQHRRKKNEMYSLWCDCLYKLSLANHFRDQVFWLPHNLDFRGRAYPVAPHLTHLTSDLGRSFLVFAQKKPLGPKGLDWLKIHAINLTGMKKREPMKKRLEFANEILDLIIDSARNPLKGKRWWTESDEPWQTLAACKEIDNALQSPNPEEYLTGFPVHQDGSCNGLQHYAALGRDQIGAESVNLYPSDTPQDVYSVVVGMVEEFRKKDAENGVEIAKVLEGHISRKVIKQTIMTTVYGVTKFGAKLQITRQLSDMKDFPQEYIWNGSMYLVQQTFRSLQTMFTSAKEIQDWFTDCARVISTRCNQYVQWVTPLGLPVLQPYNKRFKTTTATNVSKIQKKPDTMKQKNAFPPNFIHSLDSCHMMLTSLHCEQAGITFMSVHDCFWTHPQSVEIMSKICREQFVALHCEPILEDLSQFFHNRYVKHLMNDRIMNRKEDLSLQVFKKLPTKGKFDINKVLSSQYFFS
ncbi:DNA-directed RNA polymerase, mitochondrial isoform X2 [Harpegnathos saltator]|uniref:DNA-directed RNA polymerase, mitochondrial isoform X2 n=1 Tax=Harpegnathos saltator TaxID=610380 RepID=UPI00058DFDD3|nr:DNA-directed RNA polymerase, mitochondrial isoform X2 [Harpegnathos saltator]